MGDLINYNSGLQNANSFVFYENNSRSCDTFNTELILEQMEKVVKEKMVEKSFFRSERQFWPFVNDNNDQMKRRMKRPPCSRKNPQFCRRKGSCLKIILNFVLDVLDALDTSIM
jgi:hypothetical protein